MAIAIADTATVDPRADLADGVDIGPYCVVGPEARIGPGSRLIAHVCVLGRAEIGAGNVLGPFVVVGAGEGRGAATIGDGNAIREGSTIERGDDPGESTSLGDRGVIGPHAAIGRGSSVAEEATIGAGARLGAGVLVETAATIGAGVEVHPAATVGAYAFVGGPSRVHQDVPKYMIVDGSPPRVRGVNIAELRRRGVPAPTIRSLREAHRLLYRAKLDPMAAARSLVDRGQMTAEVARLIESLIAQRAGLHGRAREARSRASPPPSTATEAGAATG